MGTAQTRPRIGTVDVDGPGDVFGGGYPAKSGPCQHGGRPRSPQSFPRSQVRRKRSELDLSRGTRPRREGSPQANAGQAIPKGAIRAAKTRIWHANRTMVSGPATTDPPLLHEPETHPIPRPFESRVDRAYRPGAP